MRERAISDLAQFVQPCDLHSSMTVSQREGVMCAFIPGAFVSHSVDHSRKSTLTFQVQSVSLQLRRTNSAKSETTLPRAGRVARGSGSQGRDNTIVSCDIIMSCDVTMSCDTSPSLPGSPFLRTPERLPGDALAKRLQEMSKQDAKLQDTHVTVLQPRGFPFWPDSPGWAAPIPAWDAAVTSSPNS